jgi:2-polyprenyl-6-methoxyphenol hydroxylase-like FAD-dependent oxidoreductase
VLDQRGVAERFVAAGTPSPAVGFAFNRLDIGDFPTRRNYLLALWQQDIEDILAHWVLDELGVEIRRRCEVTGLTQDDDGVDVELSDGTALRAGYLVGCDGGRSVVRKAAGIDFPGLAPSASWLIAEADLRDQPPVGVRPEGGGIGPVDPTTGGGPYRAVVREREAEHEHDPTPGDLTAELIAVYGTDFGVHDVRWISRFTDGSRQAATYRNGRVLLAGDAAHIHPPQGGQGLNIGVQDAVNLGWKLAQVVEGASAGDLLDTYHAERHPVGARVLQNTSAQVALATPDERHAALRDTVSELLEMDEPRRRVAAMMSGLDVRYDLGDGHPLVGRRLPDLDLETADGPTTAYALLRDARGLLLTLGERCTADLAAWSDRLHLVDARATDTWTLPVVGEVPAPPAVLVRPDGHVAWTGATTDPGLVAQVERWFGLPAATASPT